MSELKQLKLLSGETVLATYIGPSETEVGTDVYVDSIQLLVMPSQTNPKEQTIGFAPFPEYANPRTKTEISINRNNVVYYVSPDDQFKTQYNQIFSGLVTPSQEIFVG